MLGPIIKMVGLLWMGKNFAGYSEIKPVTRLCAPKLTFRPLNENQFMLYRKMTKHDEYIFFLRPYFYDFNIVFFINSIEKQKNFTIIYSLLDTNVIMIWNIIKLFSLETAWTNITIFKYLFRTFDDFIKYMTKLDPAVRVIMRVYNFNAVLL